MRPAVALTFDDGPGVGTDQILNLLAAHEAHATFFVLGSNIIGQEQMLRRTVSEEHEIGVHGWDHRPCDELTPGEIACQLGDTCVQIGLTVETVVRWWRPPWHRVTPAASEAAERMGLSYCGVTIDSHDVTRSHEQIFDNVIERIGDGAIVGLHDGIANNGNQNPPHRKNTIRAVARLLNTLGGECRFVTVSELLA